MALAGQRQCTYPRCGALVTKGRCARHKPKDDARPSATRRGYDARWRRVRRVYLGNHPFCVHCQSLGRTTAATVVDHIEPHRGDMVKFWNEANWQSLCGPCHNQWKARIERGNG